jgi:hypothetical protein
MNIRPHFPHLYNSFFFASFVAELHVSLYYTFLENQVPLFEFKKVNLGWGCNSVVKLFLVQSPELDLQHHKKS